MTENRSQHFYLPPDSCTEPAIISRYFETGITVQNTPDTGYFLFLLKGRCQLKSNTVPELIVEKGQFTFLPGRERFSGTCSEHSHVVLIRGLYLERVCLSPFIRLSKEKMENNEPASPVLSIDNILNNYLTGLALYLDQGITGDFFYYFKIKEFFFILKEFYSRQDIANLISSILHKDLIFIDFVQENWEKVKNASELARLSLYCESSFNRKFKKVFGITPYKWLNQKRALSVYEELRFTDTPFKVIADKMNFASLQHFNDYCVRNFKATPGKIRNLSSEGSEVEWRPG